MESIGLLNRFHLKHKTNCLWSMIITNWILLRIVRIEWLWKHARPSRPLKILLAKMESGCASTLPRHQKMIHLTLIEMLQLPTTQTYCWWNDDATAESSRGQAGLATATTTVLQFIIIMSVSCGQTFSFGPDGHVVQGLLLVLAAATRPMMVIWCACLRPREPSFRWPVYFTKSHS